MTAQPSWKCADGWTAARVDMLYRHYALGMTAAQSALALGGVSIGAVISKRLRLGLIVRGQPAPVGVLAGLPLGRWRRPLGPPPLPCEPLPAMDFPPPVLARPSRLINRGRHDCAWPLGPAEEPGDHRTIYCCAPRTGRGPYCPAHAARARRPSAVGPMSSPASASPNPNLAVRDREAP